MIQVKAKEREKELNRQFADKERHLQETQMIVARKLGESEHRVSTLQSGQSVCQLVSQLVSHCLHTAMALLGSVVHFAQIFCRWGCCDIISYHFTRALMTLRI